MSEKNNNTTLLLLLVFGLLFYFMFMNNEHFETAEDVANKRMLDKFKLKGNHAKVVSISYKISLVQSQILSNENFVAVNLSDLSTIMKILNDAIMNEIVLLYTLSKSLAAKQTKKPISAQVKELKGLKKKQTDIVNSLSTVRKFLTNPKLPTINIDISLPLSQLETVMKEATELAEIIENPE